VKIVVLNGAIMREGQSGDYTWPQDRKLPRFNFPIKGAGERRDTMTVFDMAMGTRKDYVATKGQGLWVTEKRYNKLRKKLDRARAKVEELESLMGLGKPAPVSVMSTRSVNTQDQEPTR